MRDEGLAREPIRPTRDRAIRSPRPAPGTELPIHRAIVKGSDLPPLRRARSSSLTRPAPSLHGRAPPVPHAHDDRVLLLEDTVQAEQKHAAEHGLKTAIIESRDMGGTCVNRGCVPSKALLAASGKVRELADDQHLRRVVDPAPRHVGHVKQAVHALEIHKGTEVGDVLDRSGDAVADCEHAGFPSGGNSA